MRCDGIGLQCKIIVCGVPVRCIVRFNDLSVIVRRKFRLFAGSVKIQLRRIGFFCGLSFGEFDKSIVLLDLTGSYS